MGAVTRLHLAQAMVDRLGFSRRMSLKMVDAVFDIVSEAVRSGDTVKVVRFGRFEPREVGERSTISPNTGRPVRVRGGRSMVFLPSKGLKEAVNGAGKGLLQDWRGE